MTQIRLVTNSDGSGRIVALGHCDPTVCCAITTLEDALAANLREAADIVARDAAPGELIMTWRGAGAIGPATYTRIAMESLAAAHPDDVALEVLHDY